ncbi:MAG: hypothetical protein HOV81_15580 [Kofleriaceae bacterium]|nr:hypothetical protein [Kofleriaceae bacterium]
MQKSLPAWAFGVLGMVGAALVGSMILNWVDLGGDFTVRGYQLALDGSRWFLLVPLAGILLVAASATRSAHTRLAAIFAGIVVAGYVMFGLTKGILTGGLDLWLMLGGAGAMLAGAGNRTWLRAAGGAAVLAGFFAPWADLSLAGVLWEGDVPGLAFKSLWLIPVAGVAGLLSAGGNGAKLSAGAGITVYGAFVLVVGKVALAVFGLGAWVALAASSVALVIGVLARGSESAAASKQLSA